MESLDNFLEICSWNGINVQEIQTWLCIKPRTGIFRQTKQRSGSSLPMTYPWASGDLLFVGGNMATKCKKNQHGTHSKLQFAVCDIRFSEGTITPTLIELNWPIDWTEFGDRIDWTHLLSRPGMTKSYSYFTQLEKSETKYKPINLKHQLTSKMLLFFSPKNYSHGDFCQATKASFLARPNSRLDQNSTR